MVLLMPKSLRGGHMMPIEISHPIQQMIQEMSQWCRSILDRHFHGNLNRMSDHFNTVLQRHFRDDPFFPVFQRSNVATLVRSNSAHEDGSRLKMKFDMLQFSPNEVSVRVSGNTLIVEARQKEKREGYSYVKRYFKKRYLLPEDIDTDSIHSNFSSDNVLTVMAERLNRKSPLRSLKSLKEERIIPVHFETENMSKKMNQKTESSRQSSFRSDNGPKETVIPVSREESFKKQEKKSVSSLNSEKGLFARLHEASDSKNEEKIISVDASKVKIHEGTQKQKSESASPVASTKKERIIPVSLDDSDMNLNTSKPKQSSPVKESSLQVQMKDSKASESSSLKSSFSTADRPSTDSKKYERIIPVCLESEKPSEATEPLTTATPPSTKKPSLATESPSANTSTSTSNSIKPVEETADDFFKRINATLRNERTETDHKSSTTDLKKEKSTSNDKFKLSSSSRSVHSTTSQSHSTNGAEKPAERIIPVQYDKTKTELPITSTISFAHVNGSCDVKDENIIPVRIEETPVETATPTQTTETLEIEKTRPQMTETFGMKNTTPTMRLDPVWEMLQKTSHRYKSLLDRVFMNDLKDVVEKFNNAWDVSKSHTDFLTDSSIFSSSAIKEEPKQYVVKIDVKNFTPEELNIKVFNNCVCVEGKHEEKKDETGYVSRNFSRKYQLPAHVDEQLIRSELTGDGLLIVTAPKTSVESSICHERIIPITLPQDDNASDTGVLIREMSVCSSGTAPSDYEVDMSV